MSYGRTDSPRRPPQSTAGLVVACLIGAGVGAGLLWYLAGRTANPGGGNDPNAVPRAVAPRSGFDADEVEAIDLFKGARDSVVNVDTLRLVRRADMRVEAQQTGTGSGFVWDADGRIVTNSHVVKDAVLQNQQVRVVFADRTPATATVIGFAPEYDLAVLQVDAPWDKLKPIKLGSSKDLEVGQKVFAIGNPFGLSLSLTKGIVSALDREIESLTDRPISGAIQTDAPINPGNSGGPLLDKDGRLIGVNTSIASPSGGNVGIGFAIPVDTVNEIVPELIRNKRALRAGLNVQLADQRAVRRAGFPKGVMIETVIPGGAAAAAGLRGLGPNRTPGDLILSVNGEEVAGIAEFQKMLGKFKPGDAVKLRVERNEQAIEVEVTLRGV